MKSDDEDFAAMFQESLAQRPAHRTGLRPGAAVEGTVVEITHQVIFVDIGLRTEAEIDRSELTDARGELTVKRGDRVRATLIRMGDRPALTVRFGKNVDALGLELAYSAKTPVQGVVTKAVKGGLEVEIGSTRAFCPVSQIDRQFTADPAVYEGQTLTFLVLEIREGGRSVVVSRRAYLEQEQVSRASEALTRIRVGDELEGTVTSTQAYGAFVDLDGVEGMVHISELAHGRVSSVKDFLTIGEHVKVKVLEIEQVPGQAPRVRLSMKALADAPAAPPREDRRPAETILDGTVTKVEPFGVFVQTSVGLGVVPTRELNLPQGSDARRRFPVGKEIRVVQHGVDAQGRPRLSVRGVEDAEARAEYKAFRDGANKKSASDGSNLGTLGALLMSRLPAGEAPQGAPKGNGRK